MKKVWLFIFPILLISCGGSESSNNEIEEVEEGELIEGNSEMSNWEQLSASCEENSWLADHLKEVYLPRDLHGQGWFPVSMIQDPMLQEPSEDGAVFYQCQHEHFSEVIVIDYEEGVPQKDHQLIIRNGASNLEVEFNSSENYTITMTMKEGSAEKRITFDRNQEGLFYPHPEFVFNDELNAPSLIDLAFYAEEYFNWLAMDESQEEQAAVTYKSNKIIEYGCKAEEYWLRMSRELCGAMCTYRTFSFQVQPVGDTKMVSCNIGEEMKYPGWPELISYAYLPEDPGYNPNATYLFRETTSSHIGFSNVSCYLYISGPMDERPKWANYKLDYCSVTSKENGCDYCEHANHQTNHVKFSYSESDGNSYVEVYYVPISYDDNCNEQAGEEFRDNLIYNRELGYEDLGS